MNCLLNKIRYLSAVLFAVVLVCNQASYPVQALPLAQNTASCTSKSGNAFYLRTGPGPQYQSAGQVDETTPVKAIARDQSSKWLHVKAIDVDGWSAAAVLQCDSNISKLPVDPHATNPGNQNGKKVSIRKSRGPDGGRNDPDFIAELYTAPFDVKTFGQLQNIPVFHDALSFRVKVFDKTKGNQDGAGIEFVQFTFIRYQLDDDGNPESVDAQPYEYPPDDTPSFCAFAGNDPSCNPALRPDDSWPDGIYEMRVQMQGKEDDAEGGRKFSNWNQYFFAIQRSNQSTRPAVVAKIVQTGAGNADTTVADALVFQVEAYNTAVGNQDGDGIDHIDMQILGPNGRQVYNRTEKTAHYCAFSGGEPDCMAFDFAENNDQWPNRGPQIRHGATYTLRAVVYAKDGQRKEVKTQIEIQ